MENTSDYIANGLKHLSNRTVYEELPHDPTEGIGTHINKMLDGLRDKGYIDEHEYKYMKPKQPPRTQQMYFLKKLHKNPYAERPIVSGCDGITENVSAYLDHILKPLMKEIPSYLKNTYQLLEELDSTIFPSECILCTIDVVSLYPSIPQKEGTESCLNMLEDHNLLPFPKEYVKPLFEFVLSCNVFCFAGQTYRQVKGTAMGTRMAPTYANVFMAKVEEDFLKDQQIKPAFYRRYIDDILMVWTGSKQDLDKLLNKLNSFHQDLKFTYNISEDTVTYLDVDIYKGQHFQQTGRLDYKTHFKQTNKLQYLHYNSAHPSCVKRGLVKGELTRISKTTSNRLVREEQSQIVRKAFNRRGYPRKLTTSAITNTTTNTLDKGDKSLRFKTTFNPRHQRVLPALKKHWPLVLNDSQSTSLHSMKPSICFKVSKNIGNHLVRAKTGLETATRSDVLTFVPPKIPKNIRISRCYSSRCPLCTNIIDIHKLGKTVLRQQLSCESNNVVYAIICILCPLKVYIGQTTSKLKLRYAQHINRARKNKRNWPLYNHFNQQSHNFKRDSRVFPIERCRQAELLAREAFWIRTQNTKHPKGLNSMFSNTLYSS